MADCFIRDDCSNRVYRSVSYTRVQQSDQAIAGAAPPIDLFTGGNNKVRFDDCLPKLERAAALVLGLGQGRQQLAGYHCRNGSTADRATYQSAVVACRTRLNPGNETLTALDFRHIVQKETESGSDFIRRLKCTFQIVLWL